MEHEPQEVHVPVVPISGAMSARDVTELVKLFVSMLHETKNDLLAAMSANSLAAHDRWTRHEAEHAQLMEQWRCELEELSTKFTAHEEVALARWKEQDHEEEVFDARVEPLKAGWAWIRKHWRDLLIVMLGLLALLGFSTQTLETLFGL